MIPLKQYFGLILIILLSTKGFTQNDTTAIEIKIFKKVPAPEIIPIISDNGILEKLTTSGCLDLGGELSWFDANNQFMSYGDFTVLKQTGKFKAVCIKNQKCPSDTAFFTIDSDFVGLVTRENQDKKFCVGSENTFQIEGCDGKIFWEDGFQQVASRTIKVQTNELQIYRFRCLQANDISKFVDIRITPENSSLSGVIVYPNPVFDILKLKSESCLNGVFCKIYNLIGQEIFNGWAESIDDLLQLNISQLPSNEYILVLELMSTGQKEIKRFIKLAK